MSSLPWRITWAFLVPLVLLAVASQHYSHGLPTCDDWNYLEYYRQWRESGSFPWAGIFEQHYLHWLPMLKLGVIAACHWADGELRALLGVGLIWALTAAVGSWWLWHRDCASDSKRTVWVALAIAWSWFSLSHAQVWLWGTLFVTWFPMLALVVCGWVFRRQTLTWMGCLIAVLASTLSFSAYGNGVLVWLCVFIDAWFRSGAVFPWQNWTRRERIWWAIWVVLGVGTIIWRLQAGVLPHGDLVRPEAQATVPDLLHFLARLTGVPLGTGTVEPKHLSTALGALIWIVSLFTAGWFLLKGTAEDRRRAAWGITLMAFGAGSAVLVTLGRYTPGLTQAMESRYAAMTFLMPLGTLMAWAARRADARTVGGISVLNLIGTTWTLLMLLGWLHGLQLAHVWKSVRLQDSAAAHFCHQIPDHTLPQTIANTPTRLRTLLTWLAAHDAARVPPLAADDTLKGSGYGLVSSRIVKSRAGITSIEPHEEGWSFSGFGMGHAKERPADLILITVGKADDHPRSATIVDAARPWTEDVWDLAMRSGWKDTRLLTSWTLRLEKADLQKHANGEKVQLWMVDELKKRIYPIDHEPLTVQNGQLTFSRPWQDDR
ncbi:MAG: hypothetical protein JNJ83_21465 [Verrucomicrobiaceae bacterium]|nr:hypothetical protein [Verrucomicrobiaceae bacterium]